MVLSSVIICSRHPRIFFVTPAKAGVQSLPWHEQETRDGALSRERRKGAEAIRSNRIMLSSITPYAGTLRERLRLPVYGIYAFVGWFHAGFLPRDFGPPGSAVRDWRER
jgi:hypothetical protein